MRCISTLNNGVATQVRLYLGTNISKNDLTAWGGYVDDSWQVNRRLSLSLGIRLDRYKPSLPDQSGPTGQVFSLVDSFVTWNNLGRRLGASTILTGDGKTVVKGHYGQYYLYPGVNFTSSFNPNPSGSVEVTRRGVNAF